MQDLPCLAGSLPWFAQHLWRLLREQLGPCPVWAGKCGGILRVAHNVAQAAEPFFKNDVSLQDYGSHCFIRSFVQLCHESIETLIFLDMYIIATLFGGGVCFLGIYIYIYHKEVLNRRHGQLLGDQHSKYNGSTELPLMVRHHMIPLKHLPLNTA